MADTELSVVVLLHGFQDDPGRLLTLAPTMGIDPTVTAVLAPRGPIDTGAGPSWFDDGSDLAAALDGIDDVIDEQVEALGADRSSVVVGGVSQGGATALALALRAAPRPPIGGAFAISGFLLPPDAVSYDFDRATSAAVDVLISHGEGDEVVAIQQGRSAARTLERQGLAVTFREHPRLGHQLDGAYFADVRHWLADRTP